MRSGTVVLWVCGLLLGLVGCGPARVPVSGTLLNNGEPIADANVSLSPIEAEGGQIVAARTDAQGQFRLQTPDRQDIVAGRYKVLVIKMDAANSVASTEDGLESEAPSTANVPKSVVDPKWSKPASSPLEIVVAPGMESLTIDLAKP